MLDVPTITSEVDKLCDAYIEEAALLKMRYVVYTALAFCAVGFGSAAVYAAFSRRKLALFLIPTCLYPLAWKFFIDGHVAFLKAEKVKRNALTAIEKKYQTYLSQENENETKESKSHLITDLVRKNAGTISSGVMMVVETAIGFPIHTILKSSASYLMQQLVNQQKPQQEINPEIIAIFNMEYRRLVLQAALDCYEKYLDEAMTLRFASAYIKVPSLKEAITDRLKKDLAKQVAQKLEEKNLIKPDQIEQFKTTAIPDIIEAITVKLTDLSADWIEI